MDDYMFPEGQEEHCSPHKDFENEGLGSPDASTVPGSPPFARKQSLGVAESDGEESPFGGDRPKVAEPQPTFVPNKDPEPEPKFNLSFYSQSLGVVHQSCLIWNVTQPNKSEMNPPSHNSDYVVLFFKVDFEFLF